MSINPSRGPGDAGAERDSGRMDISVRHACLPAGAQLLAPAAIQAALGLGARPVTSDHTTGTRGCWVGKEPRC